MARVLVVGRGAREAALAWSLARSPQVDEVVVLPGNDGMRAYAEVLPDRSEADALRVASDLRPSLVVIGPEAPLAGGLADRLQEVDVPVFGPTAAAARIESSKLFAKEIMRQAGVPTATPYLVHSAEQARDLAARLGGVALKADGLRQGKGVILAHDPDEAAEGYRRLAAEGGPIYAEELLTGREVSLFGLSDGRHLRLLPAARDFKRAYDGDEGPNTGGMGALAPVLPQHEVEEAGERILRPVLETLKRRGMPFVGCLYAGCIRTAEGMMVLEFNARFGDPEAEVVLPILGEDLYPFLAAAATGELSEGPALRAKAKAAAVVVAAQGYPEAPRLGTSVEGLTPLAEDGSLIFWAGARSLPGGQAEVTGGRIAAVVGVAETASEAVARAYRRLAAVRGEAIRFRQDIRFCADEAGVG